jgi:enamine deaminase RidA (YjgF/YER057c/UK114 family)
MKLNPVSGSTPEARLEELGLTLPPVPEPVADYVTYTQIGSIIYISGMLPWVEGDLKFKGKSVRT